MSAVPGEPSEADEVRGQRLRVVPAVGALALLVLLAALGWLGWEHLRAPEQRPALLRETLEQRFAAFEQRARRLELEAERRGRRLEDLERVHRGLREDLLALRERLATIDRSLESLARRSQRAGELPVLLELEHLLAAAELRERALGDRRGAIALLAAAEELLRSRPEATLVELREMLAEDRRRLERLGTAAGRAAAERRLAELLALAPALRALDAERPALAREATLGERLGRLVLVERIGERRVPILPEPVARLLFVLELRLLSVALLVGDAEAFAGGRERLLALLAEQFHPEDEATRRARALLEALGPTPPPASEEGFPVRALARVRALLAQVQDPGPEPPSPGPAP